MNSLSDLLDEKRDDLDIPASAEPIPDAAPSAAVPDHATLKTMIYSIKDQLDSMLRLLDGEQVKARVVAEPDVAHSVSGERMIEGVFNGEKMVGSDGKEYPVPPNYASKSKLVEGDMMKLTITNGGKFLFKQIGPIERKRLTGELVCDPSTNQWSVLAEGRPYKVLTASVTFYRAQAGDEAFILVPTSGESSWGAVDNIITKA